ncbi:initiator RepB protein (plasmid) [Emticicia oligotrophica DSM 17448]|uniref:Initiator RepB protein n=1 Tax=Emticicia oligotrophica (strain DSM 17448 / CIP 109782 / MTCC 6937 / GPTSA100-15) TaxID=929562 RepID=A0ABM5N871_EMTOG|nr:replication initiation protein [Emticicia oligotrophica]AFK05742.1 initiator RepB protein [Emticicia oligotrophica DSM 17448]
MPQLSVRKKQDYQERYTIRIQGGKAGLVEATTKMDISEFRLFATVLTMILPDDEDFTEYEIRIPDIIKLFDLNRNGKYYEAFKDAALRLMDRKFVVYEQKEDGKEYKTTIPLSIQTSEPVLVGEQNRIRLQFHPKLKPYLLDLQREYLTVDIRNITEIQSHYSVKLYFVLKHQQRLGNKKVRYDVSRLRQILAIEEHEYPLYGSLKQKVFQKGIEDINKYTDLEITKIEEHKHVRSVVAITFHLNPKERQLEVKSQKPQRQVLKSSGGKVVVTNNIEPQRLAEDTTVEVLPQKNELFEEIYLLVKPYKISKKTVYAWINEFPKEQVLLGVNYVIEKLRVGEKIQNIGGYMNQMVNTPSLYENYKESQQKKEERSLKLQTETNLKIQSAAIEKEKAQFNESYFKAQNEFYKKLINENVINSIIKYLMEENAKEKPSLVVAMSYEQLMKVSGGKIDKNTFEKAMDEAGFTFTTFVSEWIETNFPQEVSQFKEPFKVEAAFLGIDI